MARTTNRATVLAQLSRVAAAVGKGDTAALAATDPQIAAALNDPNRGDGTRGVFQPLANLPPRAMQAMVQAGSVTTSYGQMPPQSQEMVRKATESFLPLALANVRGADGNSPGYETFIKSASYTLGVGGLEYGGNSYFGEIRAGGVSMRFAVDLGTSLAPPPAPAEAPAQGVAGAPGAGVTGAGATATTRARRPLPPLTATLDSKKPLSVHEIVDWLAEKTPLTVVSDHYATRYERPLVPVPPGAKAEAILEALTKYAEMEYTLSDDDRVIRLRSRRWPLDDLMEPPATVVEALDRAFQANGGRFGFAEYLFAAQLTDAQDTGLVRIDERRYGAFGRGLDGSRPLLKNALRLTASLPAPQRAAAESADGLPVLQMTPAQRALVTASLTQQRADLQPREIAAGVFKLSRQDRPLPAGGPPGTGRATAMEVYVFSFALPNRGQVPGDPRPTTFSTSLVVGPAAGK
jgi:hypothetical protein